MSEGRSRPPSGRRITIADVARLAEVSMGTVSNLLNGTAGVREATRQRVEAAIRELRFRPNLLARSLTGRGRDPEQWAISRNAPRLVAVGYTSVDFQLERMHGSIVAIGASGWRVAVQTTGLPAAWRTPVHMRRMAAEFDAVFLNRAVARDITNCRGGEQQLVAALVGLIGSVPAKAVVALTLGERGALVVPPGGEPVLVPAKQVDIVDATGNGGAFVGAFLAVWLHTGDPLLAAQWGTAAGSLLTSVEGAQGATPTAAEVEALMEGRAPTAQMPAAAS